MERLASRDRGLTRQCGLALCGFLLGVLPFRAVCEAPYARVVRSGAQLLTRLAGGDREIVPTTVGSFRIDRRLALEQFFEDPRRRPEPYGLLALWAWLAVAPRLPVRRRLGLAAGAAVLLAVVHAASEGCYALAWYRGVLEAEVPATPRAWSGGIAALEALGTGLAAAALFVLPFVFAVLAYPGFGIAAAADA